jgi:class 3 adenylate cyclase
VYRTTHAGLATLEANGRYAAAATVIFTDIVGSTALIDDVGEAAAHEIRQRHFALLRSAIEKGGGREIKNLGDGLMVIFGDAGAALETANEMQGKVAADEDQIGLRVGIHAGELLRDGNDFFGSTVIIARRLCDLADPGQTIVSSETCELIEHSDLVSFEPLGALELKGLTESIESSSLIWTKPSPSLAG